MLLEVFGLRVGVKPQDSADSAHWEHNFASIEDNCLEFVLVERDRINTRAAWQSRLWLIGHMLLLV